MAEIRKYDFGQPINRSGGTQRRGRTGRADDTEISENLSNYYPRGRATENRAPGNEELARLIDRALNALSRGVYWDRGSILNILL